MKSMLALLLASVVCLCSCTLPQVIAYNPDGSIKLASNGGSLATKADDDNASMFLPNGVVMTRSIHKKNEVSVPNNAIAAWVASSIAEIAAGTTKAETAAEVSKAEIKSNEVIKLEEAKAAAAAAKAAEAEAAAAAAVAVP